MFLLPSALCLLPSDFSNPQSVRPYKIVKAAFYQKAASITNPNTNYLCSSRRGVTHFHRLSICGRHLFQLVAFELASPANSSVRLEDVGRRGFAHDDVLKTHQAIEQGF